MQQIIRTKTAVNSYKVTFMARREGSAPDPGIYSGRWARERQNADNRTKWMHNFTTRPNNNNT